MENVIQSYLTTIMRGDFTLYEIRIFMKIVEQANTALVGVKVSNNLHKAFCADGVNCNLSFPIDEVLTPGSHDYQAVYKALKSLMKKKIERYDPLTRTWCAATLVNNIRVPRGNGVVSFVVAKWVMEYIINFLYGNFSRYNLRSALKLKSPYAVRLYWLTCSMKDPVKYSIAMLRAMLGVGNKYGQTKDFIKRCIEPAREMLEKENLNGFNYQKIVLKNKCTAIQFFPIKRENPSTEELNAQLSESSWIDPALKMYLQQQAMFKQSELAAHKDLMYQFGMIPDWQDKIVEIVNRARKKRANKGYIIKAMLGALNDTPKHAMSLHVLQKPIGCSKLTPEEIKAQQEQLKAKYGL